MIGNWYNQNQDLKSKKGFTKFRWQINWGYEAESYLLPELQIICFPVKTTAASVYDTQSLEKLEVHFPVAVYSYEVHPIIS